MKKTNLILLACAMLLPLEAWALNCTSQETAKLASMYKSYIQSGQEPQPQIANYEPLGTAVTVNGLVYGLVNYQPCWKDTPPCPAEGVYETAAITFITSSTEVQGVFGKDPNNALIECFRRLGLGAQPRNNNRGIFR